MKIAIVISFETDDDIPEHALESVASAAFAQLEGLTDDLGFAYRDAKVETNIAGNSAEEVNQ